MYQILSLPVPPPPFLRRQLACCLNATDSLNSACPFDLNDTSNQDLRAIITYFKLLDYTTQEALLEMLELEGSRSAIIIGLRAIINDHLGQETAPLMQTYLEQQFNSMLTKP